MLGSFKLYTTVEHFSVVTSGTQEIERANAVVCFSRKLDPAPTETPAEGDLGL
jgi:hypothetical protein